MQSLIKHTSHSDVCQIFLNSLYTEITYCDDNTPSVEFTLKELSMDPVKEFIEEHRLFESKECQFELLVICNLLDKLCDRLYLYHFNWVDINYGDRTILRIRLNIQNNSSDKNEEDLDEKSNDNRKEKAYHYIGVDILLFRRQLHMNLKRTVREERSNFICTMITAGVLIAGLIVPTLSIMV